MSPESITRRPRAGSASLALAIGLACALVLGPADADAAGPAGALVVRSGDQTPYRLATQAFAATVGRPVTEVNVLDGAARARLAETVQGADVVLALGSTAARAVAPLRPRLWLYALVQEPAKLGLDATVPGLPMYVRPARQLEVLRTLSASARRVGIAYDPQASKALVDDYALAADAAQMTLVRAEASSTRDVATAVRKLLGEVDALVLIPDATVLSTESFRFIIQTSIASRKIVVGFSEGMTKAGATLSLEATPDELGRRAGAVARQLLAGGPLTEGAPAETLTINARAATLIGQAVPDGLRKQAARIFE